MGKWDVPDSWDVDEAYDKIYESLLQEVEEAKKWDYDRRMIQEETQQIEEERARRLKEIFGERRIEV